MLFLTAGLNPQGAKKSIFEVSTNLNNNYRDFARITGIQFEFPGMDYEEIPTEELEFLDLVKRYIKKYFDYTED